FPTRRSSDLVVIELGNLQEYKTLAGEALFHEAQQCRSDSLVARFCLYNERIDERLAGKCIDGHARKAKLSAVAPSNVNLRRGTIEHGAELLCRHAKTLPRLATCNQFRAPREVIRRSAVDLHIGYGSIHRRHCR